MEATPSATTAVLLVGSQSSRNEDERSFSAGENIAWCLVRERNPHRFVSSQRWSMLRKQSMLSLDHIGYQLLVFHTRKRDLHSDISPNGDKEKDRFGAPGAGDLSFFPSSESPRPFAALSSGFGAASCRSCRSCAHGLSVGSLKPAPRLQTVSECAICCRKCGNTYPACSTVL